MIRSLLTADEVGVDLSRVDVQFCRDKPEWLVRRRAGEDGLPRIGGSQAAAALGESKWQGRYGLYLELVEGVVPEKQIKNVAAAAILEPAIGHIYAVQEGVGMLRFPDWTIVASKRRRAFFSPDFLIAPVDELGPGIFDAKTWEGGKLPEKLGPDYTRQLEHAMSVTGFRWGIVGILRGRTVYPYRVVWDDARIADLEAREDAFLADCDARRTPPFDSTPGTADAIDLKFKDALVTGPTVDLGEEWTEKLRLLRANRKMQRDSDRTAKALVKELKLATECRSFRVPGLETVFDWTFVEKAAEKRPRAATSYWQLTLGDDDDGE